MRISDWSSDVCSSDLRAHDPALREHITQRCLPARLAIADGDLPVQRAAVGVFICDQRTQARSIGKWHAIRLTNGDEAVAAEADEADIAFRLQSHFDVRPSPEHPSEFHTPHRPLRK